MKYAEPRDQSAVLLRMAINEMGQHDAAFNPISFAVWYEYVAGINPSLKQAVDECRRTSPRLDDEVVNRLYDDHVAEPGSAAVSRVGTDLRRMLTGVAESARSTGDAAGVYGNRLDNLSRALVGDDGAVLAGVLAEAQSATESMKGNVDALQVRLSASLREIDVLRADLERAREDALIDPLSGVLNRKGFDRRLGEMLAQRPRPGTAHCLVLLDMDHFKRVNDEHGHLVGDSVIQAMGLVLRKTAEESGVACARYGGEEFALMAPEVTLQQAVQIAEGVRARTCQLKVRNRVTNQTLLSPTVSAGVAAWVPGEPAAALIASADAALYRSKALGRDRVTVA